MRRTLVPICVALFAFGCASEPEDEWTRPDAPPYTGGVGSVQVQIDDTAAESDRKTLISYGVPEQVETQVANKLRAAGRLSSGGRTSLDVTITRFRLRTWSQAFWLGGMAGSDFITVECTVQEGAKRVKSYRTDTSTILGGMAMANEDVRKDRLLNTLTTRIVQGL